MTARARMLARLAEGSRRTYRRLTTGTGTWVAAGRRDDLNGWKAALGPALRTALLLGLAYGAWRVARGWPWLMWVAAAGWLLTAWRAGAPSRKVAADPEETPAPGPGDRAGEPPAPQAPAGPTLEAVLAAARELGTPHVHLAAIEAHLKAPRGTVRPVLAGAGIPITDVRMHGRGTSTGLRDADIPAPAGLSPAPVVDVVGAGQGANNNNNNGITVEGGEALTIIRDLTETVYYPATKP